MQVKMMYSVLLREKLRPLYDINIATGLRNVDQTAISSRRFDGAVGFFRVVSFGRLRFCDLRRRRG
jgi:hypothetical protein